MENWQAKAIQLLPEFRDLIEQKPSPVSLWIELFFRLQEAYDEINDERIGRIYDYAAWCLKQPNTGNAETDVSSAAAVGLVETIPLDQRISDDLYRWMSAETFNGCESLFRYHLSDTEFQKFTDDFHRKQKEFNTRPRL